MLSSIVEMASRKERPQGETLYIDEADRHHIVERMLFLKKTKAALARDCGVTASAITLLLKLPIPRGKTRGCRFLPKLQESLGIVRTTKTPSVVENKEAHRRVLRVMRDLDDRLLEHWIETGEFLASKR